MTETIEIEWHDLPKELELDKYQISKCGKVKNIITGYIFNKKPRPDGYIRVHFRSNSGAVVLYLLHRIVAMTFIPNHKYKELQVNHINSNRSDNRIENLEWVTPRENNIKIDRSNNKRRCVRSVYQIDRHTKEIIKKWDSIKGAADTLKIERRNIGAVCKDNYTTYKNYIWKYADTILLEGEIWNDYSLNGGKIGVSNYGRIKYPSGKITKGSIVNNSYYRVNPTINGKRKPLLVHRLVALVFINNPDNKPCVNHIDGHKLNNNVDNLEWVTSSENSIHVIKNNLRSNQNRRRVPVAQMDMDGKIVKKYDSITDAAKAIPVHESCIHRACKYNKTAGGYLWKKCK